MQKKLNSYNAYHKLSLRNKMCFLLKLELCNVMFDVIYDYWHIRIHLLLQFDQCNCDV